MDNGSKCKTAVSWGRYGKARAVYLGLIAFLCLAASQPLFSQGRSQLLSAPTVSGTTDPNKGPSELNHHIAGLALIAISLLQLASLRLPARGIYRYLWPVLFVVAGIFLALWSDGEIWPRGNLNWSFLLHHDAEARQHKIYSILLIGIGILEYVRVRHSLPRFWKTWGFPLLAVIGASLLLIHDHTAASGARSPEAQRYLVNPALDVDGSVRKPSASKTDGVTTEEQTEYMHRVAENAGMPMAHDDSMSMDHSQMAMEPPSHSASAEHHHLMTASMLLVEREHLWFVIVGLAIALFKFLSDGEFFRNRIMPYMSPGCMLLLGFLLVVYRE